MNKKAPKRNFKTEILFRGLAKDSAFYILLRLGKRQINNNSKSCQSLESGGVKWGCGKIVHMGKCIEGQVYSACCPNHKCHSRRLLSPTETFGHDKLRKTGSATIKQEGFEMIGPIIR